MSVFNHIELKSNGLRLTVSESEQGKADGHNKFNKANNKKIPARPFIPDEKASRKNLRDFTPAILEGIDKIIEDFKDGDSD